MEDGSSSLLFNTVVIIVMLGFSVLFTLAEYSLVRSRKSAVVALRDDLEANGRSTKKIDRTMHMLNNLSEYLSTAQAGITITSLVIGWFGESTMARIILDTGILGSLSVGQANAIASILAIILFTYIHAVFSDLLPKNIAIDIPVRTALAISGPIQFMHLILYPLVWIMDRSANLFTRLIGFRVSSDEEIVSGVELLSLGQTAAEAGEIDEENIDFMKRAFDMNEKKVSDVMVDRTSMVAINVDDTIADGLTMYFQDQYSRFPVVAEGDKDHVLGYVFNYDLVKQGRIDDKAKIATIMRDIVSVPETTKITDAMDEMGQKHVPMAIVVDEFGGTAGLITDKDIYEELFGNFKDEQDDNDDQLIKKLGHDAYLVSGKTSLYDFQDFFKVELKDMNDTNGTTLTGFVLEKDPDFRKGDKMKIENFVIKALDYDNAYINDFEVTYKPLPKNTDPNEDNYKDIGEE